MEHNIIVYGSQCLYSLLCMIVVGNMSQQVRKSVGIDEHLYENLQQKAREAKIGIKECLEEIIQRHLKKEDLMAKNWSGLKVEKFTPEYILLSDMNERKFYQVNLKGYSLHCVECNKENCIHTAFTWLQIENLDDTVENVII